MIVHGFPIYGVAVDKYTGCAHYRSTLDIIAIQFKCCRRYYPCSYCHDHVANHAVERWQSDEFHYEAILCGYCGHQLTIQQYLNCNNQCPRCHARFNPGCQSHYSRYFAIK